MASVEERGGAPTLWSASPHGCLATTPRFAEHARLPLLRHLVASIRVRGPWDAVAGEVPPRLPPWCAPPPTAPIDSDAWTWRLCLASVFAALMGLGSELPHVAVTARLHVASDSPLLREPRHAAWLKDAVNSVAAEWERRRAAEPHRRSALSISVEPVACGGDGDRLTPPLRLQRRSLAWACEQVAEVTRPQPPTGSAPSCPLEACAAYLCDGNVLHDPQRGLARVLEGLQFAHYATGCHRPPARPPAVDGGDGEGAAARAAAAAMGGDFSADGGVAGVLWLGPSGPWHTAPSTTATFAVAAWALLADQAAWELAAPHSVDGSAHPLPVEDVWALLDASDGRVLVHSLPAAATACDADSLSPYVAWHAVAAAVVPLASGKPPITPPSTPSEAAPAVSSGAAPAVSTVAPSSDGQRGAPRSDGAIKGGGKRGRRRGGGHGGAAAGAGAR